MYIEIHGLLARFLSLKFSVHLRNFLFCFSWYPSIVQSLHSLVFDYTEIKCAAGAASWEKKLRKIFTIRGQILRENYLLASRKLNSLMNTLTCSLRERKFLRNSNDENIDRRACTTQSVKISVDWEWFLFLCLDNDRLRIFMENFILPRKIFKIQCSSYYRTNMK